MARSNAGTKILSSQNHSKCDEHNLPHLPYFPISPHFLLARSPEYIPKLTFSPREGGHSIIMRMFCSRLMYKSSSPLKASWLIMCINLQRKQRSMSISSVHNFT